MKKMMFLGLLIMLGLSFAGRAAPTGPEWIVYSQTCCQAFMLAGQPYIQGEYNWALDIEGNYKSVSCSSPSLLYYYDDIWDIMWFEGSVSEYYGDMLSACMGSETSPGCLSAKNAFYSSARNARSIFATAKANYLLAARQDVSAYMGGQCQDAMPPGAISEDIYDATANYRNCIQNPMRYCIIPA